MPDHTNIYEFFANRQTSSNFSRLFQDLEARFNPRLPNGTNEGQTGAVDPDQTVWSPFENRVNRRIRLSPAETGNPVETSVWNPVETETNQGIVFNPISVGSNSHVFPILEEASSTQNPSEPETETRNSPDSDSDYHSVAATENPSDVEAEYGSSSEPEVETDNPEIAPRNPVVQETTTQNLPEPEISPENPTKSTRTRRRRKRRNARNRNNNPDSKLPQFKPEIDPELDTATESLRSLILKGGSRQYARRFVPRRPRFKHVIDLETREQNTTGMAVVFLTKIFTAIHKDTLSFTLQDETVRDFLKKTTHYDPGYSPLHLCIRKKNSADLVRLLEAGADVEAVECFDFTTPLELATFSNFSFAVLKLLQFGANPCKALEVAGNNDCIVKDEITNLLKEHATTSISKSLESMMSQTARSELAYRKNELEIAEKLYDRIMDVGKGTGEPDDIVLKMSKLRSKKEYRSKFAMNRLREEIESLSRLSIGVGLKSSSDVVDEIKDAQEEALKCPVCLDVPVNREVYSCLTCSNLVCGTCKTSLTNPVCPICRAVLVLTRNKTVERIIERIFHNRV